MYTNTKKNKDNSYYNEIPFIPSAKRPKNGDFFEFRVDKDRFEGKAEQEEGHFDNSSYTVYPDPDDNIGPSEEDDSVPIFTSPNFVPTGKSVPDFTKPFGNPPPPTEGFGDQSFGDRPFPDLNVKKIVKVPLVLPVDQRLFEKEKQENDEFGIDLLEECELCRIIDGDMIVGECARTLKKITELMSRSRRKVKTFTLYNRIAVLYNEHVYDKLCARQPKLKRWNIAMVRHHDNECDKKDLKKSLYIDLDYYENVQRYLREMGMLTHITLEDGTETIELDSRKQKQYDALEKSKIQVIKTISVLERTDDKSKLTVNISGPKRPGESSGGVFDLW